MNQSSLLAEFGDPITRVENALIALKKAVAYFFLMMKIAKTKAISFIQSSTSPTSKWR